jgi:hypothetical protein
MLRAVPNAARVAEILSRALAASAGTATKSATVSSVESLQPVSQRHPLVAAGH